MITTVSVMMHPTDGSILSRIPRIRRPPGLRWGFETTSDKLANRPATPDISIETLTGPSLFYNYITSKSGGIRLI